MTKINIANLKKGIPSWDMPVLMRSNKKSQYAIIPNNELVLAAELNELDNKVNKIKEKFSCPIGYKELENMSEIEAMILHDVSEYKIDTEKCEYVVQSLDQDRVMLSLAKEDKRLSRLSDVELDNLIQQRF